MLKPGLVLEGYEFLKPLTDSPDFSTWEVRSQRFNRLFVAKVSVIRHDEVDSAWSSFDNETQALIRLNHPHVIRLYAHFRHRNNFILIFESCSSGSVADYVRTNGALTGEMLIKTVKGVCSALNYAWSKGVYHRDINPSNILLDGHGRVRLSAFGTSTLDGIDSSDFRGSPVCAAPEIVLKRAYDPVKSDIWATGITILWMARGAEPWDYEAPVDLVRQIRVGLFVVPPDMDPGIEQMTRRMLELAPGDRVFPTDSELAQLGSDSFLPRSLQRCGSMLTGMGGNDSDSMLTGTGGNGSDSTLAGVAENGSSSGAGAGSVSARMAGSGPGAGSVLTGERQGAGSYAKGGIVRADGKARIAGSTSFTSPTVPGRISAASSFTKPGMFAGFGKMEAPFGGGASILRSLATNGKATNALPGVNKGRFVMPSNRPLGPLTPPPSNVINPPLQKGPIQFQSSVV